MKKVSFERAAKNKASWHRIKEYINKHKPGDIISRQALIRTGIPVGSVDIYRMQLCDAGILSKHSRGKYKVLYNIPEKMTTTMLWEIHCHYSMRRWEGWFITLEDKIKKVRPNFYDE